MRWLWNSSGGVCIGCRHAVVVHHRQFALARMRFRGKRQVLTGLMLMQMFPAVLALVALYAIFDRLGSAFPDAGLNTHASLVLAYSGGIAMRVGRSRATTRRCPPRSRRPRAWMAPRPGGPFAACCCRHGAAHPGGGVHPGLHQRHHRVPGSLGALLTQQDQSRWPCSKLFVHEHNFHWGDFAAAAIPSGLPITVVVSSWRSAG